MNVKKEGSLIHTTCKLHPEIFGEVYDRIRKGEFETFNSALNKLLLKALKIKLQPKK
jgi:NTP pyrophosphatase (non-canonical NTP hydrolase)